MIDVDQLRLRQQQRLAPALQALEEAKKYLAGAMARVEARERDCMEIQEDVERKLHVLDLVVRMASKPDEPLSAIPLNPTEDRGLTPPDNARAQVKAAR